MIPLKLTLENFKCYRQGVPTLRLEGVHIACLCGPNGHGKSSLLDAIAWGLWGDAIHRPQEELIHQGQQEMRVELEFLARDDRYRVIRRHVRKQGARQGNTSLELHIATGGEDGFRPITGNTVRQTEAQIQWLVGMDYGTFVNSAFLLQGRADEFTTKPPAERKRVLGDILGLGLYDRFQERARQEARQRTDAIQRAQGEIEAWAQEVARRGDYEEELPGVLAKMETAGKAFAVAESEVATLRRDVDRLRARAGEMQEQESYLAAVRQELEGLRAGIARHVQQIEAWEHVVQEQKEIEEAFASLTQLRGKDMALGPLLGPYNRLLERETSLEKQSAALPGLESEREAIERRLGELETSRQALEERRQKLEEVKATALGLTGENDRLRREMEELRAKVDRLEEGDERCPLCGTDLGLEGKQHIVGEYEAQGTALAESYRGNEAGLREVEPQRKELEREAAREEAEMTKADRDTHGRLATLTREIDQAKEASSGLADLQQELNRLGYDPQAHQRVRDALQELATAEERHRLFREATQRLPQEREDLERDSALTKRREAEVTQGEERMRAIKAENESSPGMEKQLGAAEVHHRAAQQEHVELQGRRTFLETGIQQSRELEAKKAEREQSLKSLTQEYEVYEQLAVAFGKRGVQAMLIEAALPELEAEANRLLGRMTDNAMYVRLETQRETHRREMVETLEIKVADELGIRSYETFSGGEAFRINLALRIALSRLLAHRSGAPLPTLFIDEGFGTQDAVGRERILDVIQSIAEDFQCIIVITHMEEMKDAFPVRIEVQKTASGSTFVMT